MALNASSGIGPFGGWKPGQWGWLLTGLAALSLAATGCGGDDTTSFCLLPFAFS